MSVIRSAKSSTKYNNTGKLSLLGVLLSEYRSYVRSIVDYYFDVLLVQDFEKFVNYTLFSFFPTAVDISHLDNIKLSARTMKAAENTAWRMIKAVLVSVRKKLYVIKLLKEKGEEYSHIKIVQPTKPVVPDNLPCQLDSNNSIVHTKTNISFDIIVELKSLFSSSFKKELESDNKLTLVMKSHKQMNRFMNSKKLNYILLKENSISLYFDVEKQIVKRTTKKKLGVDQGIKKLFSTTDSDGNSSFSSKDKHGWDIESIMTKMSLKKKGSKSFKKAQEHRTNYINYSINLLLKGTDASTVHFEKVMNIFKGRSRSNKMSRWTYAEIETAFKNKCELLGMEMKLEDSSYKSQRCSECGFVHANNRNKELFECKQCGYIDDADTNSSKNQILGLYEFTAEDKVLLKSKNRGKNPGFVWTSTGYTIL